MPYFIETNADGLVVAHTETHSAIQGSCIFEMPDYDLSRVGRLYDTKASAASGRPEFVDAPPVPVDVQSQITALEREKMLPRIVREMTIAQLEQWATQQGYPLDQFRIANKGYRMIKEFDEQIAALRAQL